MHALKPAPPPLFPVSQESLRESCSQVALLQQRERERELDRERERERERDQERSTQDLRELQAQVQALVERGLVRMERSSSGHLDVQVVPVVQQGTQKGQSCRLVSRPDWNITAFTEVKRNSYSRGFKR